MAKKITTRITLTTSQLNLLSVVLRKQVDFDLIAAENRPTMTEVITEEYDELEEILMAGWSRAYNKEEAARGE